MAKFDYRQADAPALVPPTVSGRWQLWLRDRPQMPYLLPFFGYLVLMLPGAVGNVGGVDWEKLWNHQWLPYTYTAKTVLAALLLWYFWPWYTRIRWNALGLGAVLGIAGTVLWIGTELLCQRIHIATVDAASINNPDALGGGWRETMFLCLRVAGPTLVVPFMEELFFRDFVTRSFVGGAHFEQVPIGKFTWLSFLATSVLFGINHGFSYFFPGLFYGMLMGVLLVRTKSLGACIVAHGMTNLTLYLYVIYTGDWQFM